MLKRPLKSAALSLGAFLCLVLLLGLILRSRQSSSGSAPARRGIEWAGSTNEWGTAFRLANEGDGLAVVYELDRIEVWTELDWMTISIKDRQRVVVPPRETGILSLEVPTQSSPWRATFRVEELPSEWDRLSSKAEQFIFQKKPQSNPFTVWLVSPEMRGFTTTEGTVQRRLIQEKEGNPGGK